MIKTLFALLLLAAGAATAAVGDSHTTCINQTWAECLAFAQDPGVADSEAEPILQMSEKRAARWLERHGWVADVDGEGEFWKRGSHRLDVWYDDAHDVCAIKDAHGGESTETDYCNP